MSVIYEQHLTVAGQFGIGNAGSMKNTGLEAEVFLRPTDALAFMALGPAGTLAST